MSQLSAETKHHILLEYRPRSPTRSFAALAARHGIAGGERSVRRWHTQWDGSAASLEHKAGAGRPRALSAPQVSRHIRAPILAANRAHRAIHYSSLLPAVNAKTGADISLRTLQRYGQRELEAKDQKTIKRTSNEGQSIRAVSVRCDAVACLLSH